MQEFEASSNTAGGTVPEFISNNIRIEGVLGRGAMGTVYRATHLSLDRVVAVKIINPEFAANADISHRFAREARTMAKLRHPHAAMIYDAGSLPDGRPFIVMEYVEGITLEELLQKEKRLPYRQAVDIAVRICDVLSAAHSLGIIHRDLKPGNIMLNNEGVFVLDFGIAKMLKTDTEENLRLSMTGTGVLMGTPYYMSPEQCMGQPVEARTDLYSLGALLYETLAGHPPFDDKTLPALIIKHATVEAPLLNEEFADIPPALAHCVNQLMAKKPEDRPVDAASARALLIASISESNVVSGNVTQTGNLSDVKPTQSLNDLNKTKLTQGHGVNTVIDPQIIKPNSPASGYKSYLAIGLAAAVFFAVLSVGTFLFLKSWSNATVASNTPPNPPINSSNTNYSTNMDHTNHQMAMGDDFAVKTQSNSEKSSAPSVPLLSSEEADKVITRITQTTEHRSDGMQIIKTPKDTALVCIHNMIDMGKTHMFAVERPNINSAWEITARVSLDIPEFHGASWRFEPQDADNDGYEDVIFTASNADNTARRCLIYVPRTRQNYSILATIDSTGKIVSTTLSPNAQVPNSAAIRTALEQAVKAP